jgi:hypothetical protein
MIGKTLIITLRYYNFKTQTVSKTFTQPIRYSSELLFYIRRMFLKIWNKTSVRLVGIQITNLSKPKLVQRQIIEDYIKEVNGKSN